MSDQQRQLREHLEQLDAELQRTQPADDAQRQQLEALHTDVRKLLDSGGPISPAAHPSAGERLTSSLQQFETTHPVLSSLIEQALNTLSSAGI